MRGIFEYNFPAFDEAERRIRLAFPLAEIFNPAENDRRRGFDERGKPGDEPLSREFLRQSMADDLFWISKHATHLVLLPGWERSKGAEVEILAARLVGVEVVELDAFVGRAVE